MLCSSNFLFLMCFLLLKTRKANQVLVLFLSDVALKAHLTFSVNTVLFGGASRNSAHFQSFQVLVRSDAKCADSCALEIPHFPNQIPPPLRTHGRIAFIIKQSLWASSLFRIYAKFMTYPPNGELVPFSLNRAAVPLSLWPIKNGLLTNR